MDGDTDRSSKSKLLRFLVQFLLFCLILGLGAAGLVYLIETRPTPGRKEHASPAVVVQSTQARAANAPLRVEAAGTVLPARSVTLMPELSGRIVYQSPHLLPGGRVRAGEVLVRIDPREFELGVKQQQAAVARAELELARERGLKAVAEREWSLISEEVKPTAEGRELALRELQLRTALVALEAARSQLAQAELRLSRTSIRAPFNAVVREEYVDIGQVVSPGSRIATLAGSDRYWVRLHVPLDRLDRIRIPGIHAEEGSEVIVEQSAGGGATSSWRGRVLRLLGDLDPSARTAQLLVEVEDPWSQSPAEPGDGPISGPEARESGQVILPDVPLLLGAWVQATIIGRSTDRAIRIPRLALRENDRLWLLGPDSTLDIRPVEVVWQGEQEVFVRGEIQPGARVITSRIAAPVHGMQLRDNSAPASPSADGGQVGTGGESIP
ncbi:MAG: HlyD family efflux transporter periplasmic adaptor subunit [Deltaproteobacteria bacterium]|nr:HlyD family efflux transporter periplasmic adaptor subunit [Deltaproteobacteria bacterium]